MMSELRIDLNRSGVSEDMILSMSGRVKAAHDMLHSGTGKGNDYIGWLDQPESISSESLRDIASLSSEIQKKCDVFIVIGIGGSYLGSKAVMSALDGAQSVNGKQVVFAGYSMSERDLGRIVKLVKEKSVAVNVISKSGKTIEPAVTFRVIRDALIAKYGAEEAKSRIIATTDPQSGVLRSMALSEGYRILEIPQNIGGRYSVLTPAGLLPIAVGGFDIHELVKGAKEAQSEYSREDLLSNNAYVYACARNVMYEKGKSVELLANFDPNLHFISEWWKQLFGESEGKDKKGLFTASVDYTTDLHSLGQYVQDGSPILFETFMYFDKVKGQEPMRVEANADDLDGLNYLEGMSIAKINECAFQGTRKAHTDGGVGNITISADTLDENTLGRLLYFFMKSCAISGYMIDVNPFNQPGVEDYKNNMMALISEAVGK
jgi:glucose-6-phosphate isomerase